MTTTSDARSTAAPPAVHACARCGGPAENDFVDFWLCTQCYYEAGSTCAGVDFRRANPEDQVC